MIGKHLCLLRIAATGLLALAIPASVRAHFIWITIEKDSETGSSQTISLFFNEPPVPEGSQFMRFVQSVPLSVEGKAIPTKETEDAVEARWVGRPPVTVDAQKDLGVMERGDKPHRLYYTARAQSAPLSKDAKESLPLLRARLIEHEGKKLLQVLFDGNPVVKARVKTYPDGGDPGELTCDENGLVEVPGLAEGKTAVWANWVDPQPGEIGGKPYPETRYYATLTYAAGYPAPPPVAPASARTAGTGEGDPAQPEAASSAPEPTLFTPPTSFARMPEPAVNSFGAAVLGDWLYIYSGHVGRTHRYSVDTTSKHFRRLSLKDRTTWEELPIPRDVQGVALISDGKYLYRIGGMAAQNEPGKSHDLHSVADFARFDPESKTWTDLAPMPTPRSTHDAVLIGRTIYVSGGWTMSGASEASDFCGDTLAFDLDKPETGWQSIEQPFERRALAVAEQGGKLYVHGGLVGGGMNVERRVDIYDPATKSWSRGPDLPGTGRVDGFGTSAYTIDGTIYYSGASGTIYRLSARGDAWELIGAWYLPRITHRILPGPDGTLLAVGGNFRGRQVPEIEAVPVTGARSSSATTAKAGR